MRIVQVDSHRAWRGGEQQVLYLARFLQAQGYDNVVVCQPGSALQQRCMDAGVPARALRIRHEADVIAAWRLGHYLRRQQIDMLHMHTPHAHTIGLFAGLLAPRVGKVVSRRVDFAPIRNRFSRWKYIRPELHYLTVSKAIQQVLVAGGIAAEQVQTVYSGIDLQRCDEAAEAPPLFPAGTRVIGTVGHLAGHKGQRYLIEAMSHLVDKQSPVGCVIAGTGDLRQALERQAAELGLSEHIRFTGFRHDVLALMRQFEIFVFPSVMEGLGTALLDAMALRKPVVATRAGGIPEVVQDGITGLLVPPQDSEALANAIQYLLQHPQQARVFGDAGRKRVEQHFTADRMATQTLSVYQRLCNELPSGNNT
jgi:glycosyltransferase involved in cell wall biosynthesis